MSHPSIHPLFLPPSLLTFHFLLSPLLLIGSAFSFLHPSFLLLFCSLSASLFDSSSPFTCSSSPLLSSSPHFCLYILLLSAPNLFIFLPCCLPSFDPPFSSNHLRLRPPSPSHIPPFLHRTSLLLSLTGLSHATLSPPPPRVCRVARCSRPTRPLSVTVLLCRGNSQEEKTRQEQLLGGAR